MIVVPNIFHRLSHTQSSPSSSHPSSLSLSPISTFRCILFLTPYSLRQQWNGLLLGASPFWGDSALPSICLRVVDARLFRSSKSPHKRNSFSRRVAKALGDSRRLQSADLVNACTRRTYGTHSTASSLSKHSASCPAIKTSMVATSSFL